jgi:hypothetical protein
MGENKGHIPHKEVINPNEKIMGIREKGFLPEFPHKSGECNVAVLLSIPKKVGDVKQ